MLNKITQKVDVLNADGSVKSPGYCFHFLFNYNREKIQARESRIKEWEFYQFLQDNWVMQFTIGYASIFDSYSFNMFNLISGEKYSFGKLRLHKKREIVYPNPEDSFEIGYKSKLFSIRFINSKGNRNIYFDCLDKKHGKISAKIKINGDLLNEKMCILTPFKENKKQFYLNYKENYYDCKGEVSIGEKHYKFDNLKGLVDSGRGYWPYKQEWVWSSLTTTLNGHDLGWNLGFGFGDLTYGTENMIFFDHKATQLGHLNFEVDFENQSLKPVHIYDNKGLFDVTLEPIFDNFTHTDFLWIHNKCHQVFYKAKGTIIVDDNKYELNNIECFLEHATNQW